MMERQAVANLEEEARRLKEILEELERLKISEARQTRAERSFYERQLVLE